MEKWEEINMRQLKRKKKQKKVLETLIRIQHGLKYSARGSCIYSMKHPQGIIQH